MKLTAILATDVTGGIGQGAGLPWPRMSRDLRRFRDTTMGKVCLVGRKTAAALPRLPDRRLAVLTTTFANKPWLSPGVDVAAVCGSVEQALAFAKDEPEVMVIGGAEVYRQLLPRCDRLLLTVVHGEWPANTYLERPTEGFVQIASETHDPDESSPARLTFSEWVRP